MKVVSTIFATAMLLLVGLFVLMPGPAEASMDTFDSVADTYALDSSPDTNFGSADTMWVGQNSGPEGQVYRMFLRFDLSSIGGAIVDDAQLQIEAFDQGMDIFDVGFFLVTETWGESTLTWNDQPSFAATPDYVYAVDTSETGGGSYSYNVTTLAQSWADGSNYGMAVVNDTAEDWIGWGTKERGPTQRPVLTVTYLTVNERIDNLRDDVDQLETNGDLTTPQANALRRHLDTAQDKYNVGDDSKAISSLNKFDDKVAQYVNQGILTQAQGDNLTDQSAIIIAQIQAEP